MRTKIDQDQSRAGAIVEDGGGDAFFTPLIRDSGVPSPNVMQTYPQFLISIFRIVKPSRGMGSSPPNPWIQTHLSMYESSSSSGPDKPSTEKPCQDRHQTHGEKGGVYFEHPF